MNNSETEIANFGEVDQQGFTTGPMIFATGNAKGITAFLTSLVDKNRINQVFLDRAVFVLYAAIPAMVELRDKGLITINIVTIDEFTRFDKLIEMAAGGVVIEAPINFRKDPINAAVSFIKGVGRVVGPSDVTKSLFSNLTRSVRIELSPQSTKCVTDVLASIPGYVANATEQPLEVSRQFNHLRSVFDELFSFR